MNIQAILSMNNGGNARADKYDSVPKRRPLSNPFSHICVSGLDCEYDRQGERAGSGFQVLTWPWSGPWPRQSESGRCPANPDRSRSFVVLFVTGFN